MYKKECSFVRRCEEFSTIPPFLRKGGMVLGDEAIQGFAIPQNKDTLIFTISKSGAECATTDGGNRPL